MADGDVELVSEDHGVGDTAEHGLDGHSGDGTAAETVENVPQRRAHRELTDIVALELAGHRAHDGARGPRRADGVEPAGASSHDLGHVGDRLHVVDQRGRVADRPPGIVATEADAERRHDPRERTTAVDGLEQRRLLAVEILVGAFED